MRLRKRDIVVNAAPGMCFEVVAAAGRRLEKRSETEWVVEYVTEAAGHEIKTVELLNGDKTKLTYSGTFSVGKGPLGWLFGRLRVKPLYDRAVKEHLAQTKEIAEKRAQRSRVHSRSGQAQREEPR